MAAELNRLAPASTLDFGCGEGFLLDKMADRDVSLEGYCGLDLRQDALANARTRHPSTEFICDDVFQWPTDDRKFDLVIASEVMEHLINPETFLPRLGELSAGHVLLTVPHEPWFQLANLARGRDLIRLGNHPEHINHWNLKTFSAFVGAHLTIKNAWTVFPFIFLLATPK